MMKYVMKRGLYMLGSDDKNITDFNDMDSFQFGKDFHLDGSHDDGYYAEYCRLYLANVALTSQVRELLEERHDLQSRLRKYEDEDMGSFSGERGTERSKRMRRNADEIQRYYKCSLKACGKSYGSEGSLNQHYKLKHPEIYATLPNVLGGFEEESKENKKKNANCK